MAHSLLTRSAILVNRVVRTCLTVAIVVALVGPLALCTNYTRRVSFSLSSHREETTLAMSVARLGTCFNIHGGCSDSYEFLFPSGMNHIRADQISHYSVNCKSKSLNFTAKSRIHLKVDGTGCAVSVSLFGADGVGLPVNGVHRVKYCGQEYFENRP